MLDTAAQALNPEGLPRPTAEAVAVEMVGPAVIPVEAARQDDMSKGFYIRHWRRITIRLARPEHLPMEPEL